MIKIGILIKDFNTLENWELRIIENIKNDPNLELTLLIKDGRDYEEVNQLEKNTLGKIIFSKQILFEKKRYLKDKQTVNKVEIIKYLNTISTIKVKPKSEGFVDIFSKDGLDDVRKYNLDIIIKLAVNTISGEIVKAAKHGIWILYHGDNSKKIGPPNFREIVFKKPVVGVTLLKLTSEKNKGLVIDKAYYNRHNYSYVETNNRVLESSVSLLFKNIKKLEREEYLDTKELLNFNETYNLPNLYNTIKYIFNYHNNLFKGILNKIFALFGKRTGCWSLFIGKENFIGADLSKSNAVKLPKGEFWADPFLFKYHDQHYTFFENYSYKEKKGKISCGLIEKNKILDIVDVLDLEYHLSYPFIFEENGEIYLMPETSENKRLEIYKCTNFPNDWELYSTAFEGETVFDASFFNDKLKQKWLFINKQVSSNSDFQSELYIYKVDSLKINKLEPHKQNPVIIDSRIARNGGAIFEFENKLYRPSQSNTDGVYGKALNINQIKKLTIDEYEEELIKKIEPNFRKDLVSMHHLHQIDGMFIFDAAYKRI